MNHRTGLDRSQTLLFPERLEDYVAAENPVRFLDVFVGSLDLHALGFAKARCADTGRPPYYPAVLLKLYLYGYLHRVRSSRALEAECQRNVEVIWLTGKQTPDFKTIADFRKDNLAPLKAVARQFTVLCRKLELFGGELLAIDGSKFAAVNARDRNFNAAKLEDLIARADVRLAEYFQQLDAGDAAEPGPGQAGGVGGETGLAQGAAGTAGGGAEANLGDGPGHAEDADGARDGGGLQCANRRGQQTQVDCGGGRDE
jgi:transposase